MEKQQYIPQLRFPEFNGEWKKKKIEDLFDFKNGINKEKEYFGRGTPIINFKDVYNNIGLTKGKIKGLIEITSKEKESYSAQVGDVFFTRTSETIDDIGMSATLIENIDSCIFSGFILRARPKKQELSMYFTQYCFSIEPIRAEIVKHSSYTTRALTSGTLLNKVKFSFPTLPEQIKIANFFTAIDEKLQALKKKHSLLEQYKKGVMQKLFSQQLRFKDDNGTDFPKWEHKKITDIAITSIGLVTTMTTSYVAVGIPLIRNSDIKENRINKSQLICLDEAFASKHKHKKFKLKDIVTVHTGDIGVSGIIDESLIGCLGFATLNTRVNTDHVLPEYVCLYYNTPQSINYAISVATGDGRSNYNLKDFDNAIIPVPSLDEQRKISNFLLSIYQNITNIELQIKQTEYWKKGLLQKMFI